MTLSIIVPTKDRPNLLRRAISSAIRALPADAEIIVINDGNMALAEHALEAFDDVRLRLVDNGGPAGPAGARNTGISASRGGVILFMDDDDEISRGYPEMVSELFREGSADYGFSAIMEVYDRGDMEGEVDASCRGRPYQSGYIPDHGKLKHRVSGFGMGFWLTRLTYHDVGPIDTSLQTSEDIEYHFRLLEMGKRGWYSDTAGIRVHRHNANVGIDRDNQMHLIRVDALEKDFLYIINKHLKFMMRSHAARRYLSQRYLKAAVQSGNGRRGIRNLWSTGILVRTPILLPYYLILNISNLGRT